MKPFAPSSKREPKSSPRPVRSHLPRCRGVGLLAVDTNYHWDVAFDEQPRGARGDHGACPASGEEQEYARLVVKVLLSQD